MAAYRTGIICALRHGATPAFLMTPLSELFVCRRGDTVAVVRATMENENYDLAPWIEGRRVSGFIRLGDLLGADGIQLRSLVQPKNAVPKVDVDCSLRELLSQAKNKPLHAVTEGDDVVGLIQLVDLNRAALRIYLFALIVQFEYVLAKHLSKTDMSEANLRVPDDHLISDYKEACGRHGRDLKADRNLALPFYFSTRLLVHLASQDKSIQTAVGLDSSDFGTSHGGLSGLRNNVMHPKRFVRSSTDVGRLLNQVESLERDLPRLNSMVDQESNSDA